MQLHQPKLKIECLRKGTLPIGRMAPRFGYHLLPTFIFCHKFSRHLQELYVNFYKRITNTLFSDLSLLSNQMKLEFEKYCMHLELYSNQVDCSF